MAALGWGPWWDDEQALVLLSRTCNEALQACGNYSKPCWWRVGTLPCTSASGNFPFQMFIILYSLDKQIIILLKLPRDGPYWFKELDNMHVGSSVPSVTKGFTVYPGAENSVASTYVASQEKRQHLGISGRRVGGQWCSGGSEVADGQRWNVSLKWKLSQPGIRSFFPVSKDFQSTGLVPHTVLGLTEWIGYVPAQIPREGGANFLSYLRASQKQQMRWD